MGTSHTVLRVSRKELETCLRRQLSSVGLFTIPIWKIRKLMLREVKWFTGGHTAGIMQPMLKLSSNCRNQFANHNAKYLSVSNEIISVYCQKSPKGSGAGEGAGVQLLNVILEKFLKTTKCCTDIRSFIGNKIVSCLFQIALQHDTLLENGKPCFSFHLGPCCWCPAPTGHPTQAHWSVHLNLSALWNQRSHN